MNGEKSLFSLFSREVCSDVDRVSALVFHFNSTIRAQAQSEHSHAHTSLLSSPFERTCVHSRYDSADSSRLMERRKAKPQVPSSGQFFFGHQIVDSVESFAMDMDNFDSEL